MIGDFTKEEGQNAHEAIQEIWSVLTKKRQYEYLGHYNTILVFIEAAIRIAPKEDAKNVAN